MKLLVDIGNSRIKWATLDGKRISDGASFERGKTGIKAGLNKAWKALDDVTEVYVANVAGERIAAQLQEWTEKHWQLTPVFVASESKRHGVINGYAQAERLGVDRWLSLIAARHHARDALCIIDCGTAITVDVLDKHGRHQGGMILPGLTLMRSALFAGTDALEDETDTQQFDTLATNTYSAIQAGTLYTVTAAIERIIGDLGQADTQMRFILTGGDAQTLQPLLPDAAELVPDLVLRGLARYAGQQDRKPRRRKPSAGKPSGERAENPQSALPEQPI